MKKLLFIAFLLIGTFGFAGTGKVVEPIKVKNAVACCTVGTVRVCGEANENLCDRARALYCMMGGCGGSGGGKGKPRADTAN